MSWFTQHVTIGTDQGRKYNEELSAVHHDPDFSYFFGFDADSGYKSVNSRQEFALEPDVRRNGEEAAERAVTWSTLVRRGFLPPRTRSMSVPTGEDFPGPG